MKVRGILTNPNNEQPLNFVALRTLAAYVNAAETWDPRAAYEAALAEWRPRFATRDREMDTADLIRLMDCYYLPHFEGATAEALFADLAELLARDPATWGPEATDVRERMCHLRDLCARLAGLKDRALFHAMGRRVWELREELDLLDRFVAYRQDPVRRGVPFLPDSHLLQVYRGGFVPRLQRRLERRPDGAFVPARDEGNPR